MCLTYIPSERRVSGAGHYAATGRRHRRRHYASVFLRPSLAFFSRLSMDAMTMLETLVLKRWATSEGIWGRGRRAVSTQRTV